MRRTDREVTDWHETLSVIEACDCCRLGLADGDFPYIVPLNFGFEETAGKLSLYFHGALEGRKISLIAANGKASFELDRKHELVEGETACKYSYKYESVMGVGDIRLLETREEKLLGLQKIMQHYSGKQAWDFDEGALARVHVIRLDVKELSCKRH